MRIGMFLEIVEQARSMTAGAARRRTHAGNRGRGEPHRGGEESRWTSEWLGHEGVELVVIAAAGAAARELDIELEPGEERIHNADLFQALRVRPGELPMEPLRGGRPI